METKYICTVKFLNFEIKNPVFLAPLAGWTDQVFRKMCYRFGAAVCVTEMASAEGIIRHGLKSQKIVDIQADERPIGIQLYGSDRHTLAKAATYVEKLEPDFIDLNFSCPVKKIVRRGSGAALLCDMLSLADITRAVKDAVTVPVTAKIRTGWQQQIAAELCSVLEEAGIDAITLHGRTQEMQFRGKADWNAIAEAKAAVNIPVIANGDVNNVFDAAILLKVTGCDYLMIGRSARGNPWIFKHIAAYLSGGNVLEKPTLHERLDLCIEHMLSAADFYGTRKAVTLMRKHISFYIKGMPKATELRMDLFAKSTIQDMVTCLSRYQNSLES